MKIHGQQKNMVYPSSFKDSNGDGFGGIPGIISKLDYQKALGYGISEYRDVYEPYGTVKDVGDLIAGYHERGIKESSSSIDNPKRDWNFFSGSVWEWDEASGEYCLHYFATEQSDLNWENSEVREAIYEDAMRFWLDKGCDGFRIDVINLYSKLLDFPGAPVVDPSTSWQPAFDLMFSGFRMHVFISEMHEKVLSHYDCMTVGESFNTPDSNDVLRYVSAGAVHINEVLQIDLITLGLVSEFKFFLENSLENHDTARSVSCFDSEDPKFREVSAKILAIFLTTLTDTTYVYQGQKLDIESLNYYNEVKASTNNNPEVLEKVMSGIKWIARGHDLPVHWDSSTNVGFNTGKPWMRENYNYKEISAADQENKHDRALFTLNFIDKPQPFENPSAINGE
ncbi:glycoside hydrolase [Nadsonia fulvescens var. elongata DSM 6958]|uniref:Glycoside hydrolase n=1 Tax=Nadsonia fulvescens var. elongata DSM 6958 TaxID=857566 RepID=A0A1E3PJT8_9ASCO|nr:glycoside hydrolase [Nadsonia fulvescens var. elongata DSM 6958]